MRIISSKENEICEIVIQGNNILFVMFIVRKSCFSFQAFNEFITYIIQYIVFRFCIKSFIAFFHTRISRFFYELQDFPIQNYFDTLGRI